MEEFPKYLYLKSIVKQGDEIVTMILDSLLAITGSRRFHDGTSTQYPKNCDDFLFGFISLVVEMLVNTDRISSLAERVEGFDLLQFELLTTTTNQ